MKKKRRSSKASTNAPDAGTSSRFHLFNDDCLVALKKIADNSIDALVTDPPAGIAFMGKDWDKDKGGSKEWIRWMEQVMRECLRVLKPGAHGLVWALPRTSHWTAMALEWAGFEIRDVVSHIFGQGFPKSLDVSKAIDKAAGFERPVVGKTGPVTDFSDPQFVEQGSMMMSKTVARRTELDITSAASAASAAWAGWGTALKPSVEKWWLVYKPIRAVDTTALDALEAALWSKLSAKTVARFSKCFHLPLKEAMVDSVPADVLIRLAADPEVTMAIGRAADSSAQTDISASESKATICLSIVWSWRLIWAEHCLLASKSITGMETGLITDFRTLNYLVSKITPGTIIRDDRKANGLTENALHVDGFLNACAQRSRHIRMQSAQGDAFSDLKPSGSSQKERPLIEYVDHLAPFAHDILLVQKPLSEPTVVENVLKWGTGALNIDGSRIGTEDMSKQWDRTWNANQGEMGKCYSQASREQGKQVPPGRFPANLVLSHSPECVLISGGRRGGRRGGSETAGFQDKYVGGKVKKGVQRLGYEGEKPEEWKCADGCAVKALDEQSGTLKTGGYPAEGQLRTHNGIYGKPNAKGPAKFGASEGGASRFFYCAKISASERNAGLDGMPIKSYKTGCRGDMPVDDKGKERDRFQAQAQNTHPTVKPQKLMRYLIKLITPPGGAVLDPFMGSGSTGCAAKALGFDFIGIEREKEYFDIARARIEASKKNR